MERKREKRDKIPDFERNCDFWRRAEREREREKRIRNSSVCVLFLRSVVSNVLPARLLCHQNALSDVSAKENLNWIWRFQILHCGDTSSSQWCKLRCYYRLRLYRVRLYRVIAIILLLFHIIPHYAIAYNNAIIQFSAVHRQSIACIYTTMYVYMHVCIMHDYRYCVVIVITSPSTSRIFCLHFFAHVFTSAHRAAWKYACIISE